jgi:hypothetical protein
MNAGPALSPLLCDLQTHAELDSHTFTRLIGVKFAWTPRQTCSGRPYAVYDAGQPRSVNEATGATGPTGRRSRRRSRSAGPGQPAGGGP